MHFKIEHKAGMFFIRFSPDEYSYLKYNIEKNYMNILTTYTPPKFRSKGLASKLMKKAMKYAENHELHIIPKCDFAKKYLTEH